MSNLYRQDQDRDGLTDAQELALGTNPLSPDTDGDGQADLTEILSGRSPNLDEMRQVMHYFLEQDVGLFTKAFISVEAQITSPTLLDDLYDYYLTNDTIAFLDEPLRVVVEEQDKVIQQELTRLFEYLYRTGDGNEFIQEILEGQLSTVLLTQEDWQLGSYDSYSLETLDDLIHHQLPRESDDHFGDLVHLALMQNRLDSRSEFLRAYMEELRTPQIDSQMEIQ